MDTPLMARCACGWSVVGTADEIVAATQDHAGRVHNMTATREQVLAQATAAPATPADEPTETSTTGFRNPGVHPRSLRPLSPFPAAVRTVCCARRHSRARRDLPDPEPRACEEPPHEPDRRRRRARGPDRRATLARTSRAGATPTTSSCSS